MHRHSHLPTLRRPGAAALLALLCACGDALQPQPPGAAKAPGIVPELVGAPFTQASFYARNVWDMQLFGGLIWLGHGDSIDNWGPIPIWSLDPATGALATGFTADDEQVDLFRVLGGQLYVPGHDPRGDWSMGEFYRLEAGGWVKHRTLPHGLHAFDLALYGGRLFAALGTEATPGEETVLESGDGGAQWTAVTDEVERVYTFFDLGGELYAAPPLRNAAPSDSSRPLLRYDGARFVRTGLYGTTLLPGVDAGEKGRMLRTTAFGGALAYVSAQSTFDWVPKSLVVARDLADIHRVALPDAAAVPYDLLVRGGVLYLLAAAPADGGGYTVRVYSTGDLEHWRELFHFAAPTFARSFEESGGDFFFGLGCSYTAPSAASGRILRVRRASWTG
ncbi:MAG TPA: hypothetical protein VF092_24170 [Longimicrobium sp.]